jgi:hypothetical protein
MANATPVTPPTLPVDAGGTPPAARSSERKKTLKERLAIPRSATPYFVAALLASVAMGWYFFIFVPQKLEYFVGLRFRTLAVASGQIKGKAESLGQSLSSAPVARLERTGPPAAPSSGAGLRAASDGPGESGTAQYLRLLIPDIQLEEPGVPLRGNGLQLAVDRPPDDVYKVLRATVAWDRVASQGAAASRGEFDDLVLADARGEVLWQREKTTPRLGNLTELLYADDDKGTLMSPSWTIRTVSPAIGSGKGLPKTAALKAVRVGSTSTLMLMQAIQLESPYVADANQSTLYVAGFVSRSRLQAQAMRIPLAWLVAVSLPIALLFLALPFIKLATMNAKERFSFVNLILLAVGTLAAAGLGAVIPVGPRSVDDAGDGVLAGIATLLDEHLGEESDRVLSLARQIVQFQAKTKELQPCAVPHQVQDWGTDALCGLWQSLTEAAAPARSPEVDVAAAAQVPPAAVSIPEPVPELDVAIWLDERGNQTRKWTTKAQLTGRTSHRTFEHFQNLISGSLWSRRGTDAVSFTIEPLRAPTTAELGVVFAMRVADLRNSGTVRSAVTPSSQPDDAPFLALNVRPHSIVDAVMPPGYGFAIVGADGKVLFHSDDGLSLEENFFEEVSNAQGVRERMQLDRAVTWSGDYHGTPHRLHMQPVSSLQGSRW